SPESPADRLGRLRCAAAHSEARTTPPSPHPSQRHQPLPTSSTASTLDRLSLLLTQFEKNQSRRGPKLRRITPKRLRSFLFAPLYSVDYIDTPCFTTRLLTEGL